MSFHFVFRNYTKDDIRVQINAETGDVSFVLISPDDGSPVPASQVRDATSAEFTSELYGLSFTVAPNPSKEDEVQVVYFVY